MRTFVIHLNRAIEREPFVREIAELLPVQVISACDGYFPVVAQNLAKKQHGRELTAGEIGCAFSHLSVYMKMVDEGIEEALIFEDDAKVSAMLPKVVENRNRLPEDWELINFCTEIPETPIGEYVHDIYRATNFSGYANGCVGYMIKLSAAKKLLSIAFPVYFAADGLTGRVDMSGVVSYGISPGLVSLQKTPSNIGDR